MAMTVREIMNPEVFTVKASDAVDKTLAMLVGMGLSAAPVVSMTGRIEAVVSWRNLVKIGGGATVESRMTAPPVTVRDTDLIETAARVMALAGVHHAPVIDAVENLVGFVSVLDVTRGLIGLPAGHPGLFPHRDDETGVVWTDEMPLEEGYLDDVPEGPGVITLIHGGRNVPETLVWAESTTDIPTRLLDLLSEPQATPRLARWLEAGELRFRAAAILAPGERQRVAKLLMLRARRSMWLERIGD